MLLHVFSLLFFFIWREFYDTLYKQTFAKKNSPSYTFYFCIMVSDTIAFYSVAISFHSNSKYNHIKLKPFSSSSQIFLLFNICRTFFKKKVLCYLEASKTSHACFRNPFQNPPTSGYLCSRKNISFFMISLKLSN